MARKTFLVRGIVVIFRNRPTNGVANSLVSVAESDSIQTHGSPSSIRTRGSQVAQEELAKEALYEADWGNTSSFLRPYILSTCGGKINEYIPRRTKEQVNPRR